MPLIPEIFNDHLPDVLSAIDKLIDKQPGLILLGNPETTANSAGEITLRQYGYILRHVKGMSE